MSSERIPGRIRMEAAEIITPSRAPFLLSLALGGQNLEDDTKHVVGLGEMEEVQDTDPLPAFI